MLAKALRVIYNQGGAMGVLQRSEGMGEYKASTLVAAAFEASNGDKGMASGILNAFIGSCCDNDDTSVVGGKKAIDLMKAIDSLDSFEPDLVSLSLAYTATSNRQELEDKANEFLFRAEKVHKDGNSRGIPEAQKCTVDWAELEQIYNIQLLHDSEEFVVLSKPSGMVCYHGSKVTQKQKSKDISLEDCLRKSGVQLSTLNEEGRGLVHRIDRGTSGCLILAKTNRMHAILLSQFFLRRVKKSYQALVVCPRKKLPMKGTIQVNIDGRPAKSNYKIEKQFGTTAFTRIKVETEQGRRHQVRIHCAQGLRAPILLDPLYGGQAILSTVTLPLLSTLKKEKKFCLHADTLSIAKYDVNVQAPLPQWWKQLEADL